MVRIAAALLLAALITLAVFAAGSGEVRGHDDYPAGCSVEGCEMPSAGCTDGVAIFKYDPKCE